MEQPHQRPSGEQQTPMTSHAASTAPTEDTLPIPSPVASSSIPHTHTPPTPSAASSEPTANVHAEAPRNPAHSSSTAAAAATATTMCSCRMSDTSVSSAEQAPLSPTPGQSDLSPQQTNPAPLKPPSPTPSSPSSGLLKFRRAVHVILQILGSQSRGPTPGTISASSSTSSLTSLDRATLEPVHWIEVADGRHRYGSALLPYYDAWIAATERREYTGQSFFHFLDEGPGRNLDLKDHETHVSCRHRPANPAVSDATRRKRKFPSRKELEELTLEYCDEQQRQQYLVKVDPSRKLVWLNDGKNWKQNDPVHTGTEDKWIFVMDQEMNIYVNQKIKGRFHHSCFLAGGAVLAAGRLIVENGVITMLAPYSGHYRPRSDSINYVVDFLATAGVPTSDIQKPMWMNSDLFEDGMDNRNRGV